MSASESGPSQARLIAGNHLGRDLMERAASADRSVRTFDVVPRARGSLWAAAFRERPEKLTASDEYATCRLAGAYDIYTHCFVQDSQLSPPALIGGVEDFRVTGKFHVLRAKAVTLRRDEMHRPLTLTND